MSTPAVLVVASSNPGKVREFRGLLEALEIEIQEQPEGIIVNETENTFAANARIKAGVVAQATGMWAIGDDSGLCVEALGGKPGVLSARYGENDKTRNERLMRELLNIGAKTPKERRARFTTALALADPNGKVIAEVQGSCEGIVLGREIGRNGFGYDSLFYVKEASMSLGEMNEKQKAKYGHRGKATRKLIELMREERIKITNNTIN